jgi:hypothetical protein
LREHCGAQEFNGQRHTADCSAGIPDVIAQPGNPTPLHGVCCQVLQENRTRQT